ncbi:hypothetical protein L596_010235 [Steinernema carpocapsae]|uniref:Uncharacterized protein n=1 Tax=Steinernema carpocapsae TaxID=34508 RepID=A0A4U5PHQ8_STECR|nr:hypothetical protein L596_010235 [Steinernema carpocapsae]
MSLPVPLRPKTAFAENFRLSIFVVLPSLALPPFNHLLFPVLSFYPEPISIHCIALFLLVPSVVLSRQRNISILIKTETKWSLCKSFENVALSMWACELQKDSHNFKKPSDVFA